MRYVLRIIFGKVFTVNNYILDPETVPQNVVEVVCLVSLWIHITLR